MTEATLLGGRYEVHEQLGVGGMAEVFLGRDTRLGRDVAIKLLRNEFVGDPTFIARFRREAQSAAALNHPNIVSVYDTGDDDGVPFIVMEYVEGSTLRDCLRSEGRLDPQHALEVVADVCAALDYSHEAGIVHRDIKPANVMLNPSGTVKVMDFGIARAVTSQTMTQTAAVIGTAQYLSPEQARGEHVDARSDIYSTGCLLYELLTGTPPFSGDSPVAVAYQHVREDAPLPSSKARELSPAVDAVVMKALAKNPGNRYQSAGEMRDDLLRAAAGRAVAATPILSGQETTVMTTVASSSTTMLEPVGREPRQGRRAAAYIGLAVATLLVFLLAALVARNLTKDDGGSVAVPDLVGKTQAQALALLEQAGLEVGEVKKENVKPGADAPPPGTVIDQNPIGLFKVDKGDSVDITVSLGVKRVRVPEVVGQQKDDAVAELKRLGLKAKIVEVDMNVRKDQVLKVTPVAGTELFEGSEVTLEVSNGTVVVPSLVGLTEAAARQECARVGLDCVVQRRADDSQPPGTVLETNPVAGTKVSRSDTVTLIVAEAPSPSPEPSPTAEPTPTPTDSPSPSASPII
jgi:serine/threonine-protein kinase